MSFGKETIAARILLQKLTTWNSSNLNISGDKANKTFALTSDLRHQNNSIDFQATCLKIEELKSQNEKWKAENKDQKANLERALCENQTLTAAVNKLKLEKDDIKKEFEERESQMRESFKSLPIEADETSGDSCFNDRLDNKVSCASEPFKEKDNKLKFSQEEVSKAKSRKMYELSKETQKSCAKNIEKVSMLPKKSQIVHSKTAKSN